MATTVLFFFFLVIFFLSLMYLLLDPDMPGVKNGPQQTGWYQANNSVDNVQGKGRREELRQN
jgi:hypothetical protein